MPVKQNAMGLTTHKARTVNHIRKVIQHWPQQHIVFYRIVFDISILDNNEITGSFCNTTMQSFIP